MKKIISLALIAAIGFGANSCSPTEPTAIQPVKLISDPSSDTLTRSDSSNTVALVLNCGCPFGSDDTISRYPVSTVAGPLFVSGYGDTNIIHFSFKEPLTTTTGVHTIIASIEPTTLKSSGSSSSWIAFYVLPSADTTPLYDTIRSTAIY
jgi:hypothetical protein